MTSKKLIPANLPAMTQYVLFFATAVLTAVLTAAVVVDSVGLLVGTSTL